MTKNLVWFVTQYLDDFDGEFGGAGCLEIGMLFWNPRNQVTPEECFRRAVGRWLSETDDGAKALNRCAGQCMTFSDVEAIFEIGAPESLARYLLSIGIGAVRMKYVCWERGVTQPLEVPFVGG